MNLYEVRGIVGLLAVIAVGAGYYLYQSNHPVLQFEGDISPLPNYKGEFVSIDGRGHWRKTASRPKSTEFVAAGNGPQAQTSNNSEQAPQTPGVAPEANCSTDAIVYYADQAPLAFDPAKKGLLYGVRTHTSATKVEDMPGYNSCALVAHAILRKAGCKWAKLTADAKAVYDMAWKAGWRPSETQQPGCIVAWNSIEEGWRPRIGKGEHVDKTKKKGVKFRHLGITTGSWIVIDNTSVLSRPSPGITFRPIRYEPPLYLCPVDKTSQNQSARN